MSLAIPNIYSSGFEQLFARKETSYVKIGNLHMKFHVTDHLLFL